MSRNVPDKVFYVCTGDKCKKRGGKEISKLLRDYAKMHTAHDIEVIKTHCTDNCKHGPVVCLQPENEWHFHVDDLKAITLLKKITERE